MKALDPKNKVSYLVPMETIPIAEPCGAAEIRRTACRSADILRGRRTVVLSGAGISTDSGIPDYRGPETIKKNRKPVLHADFVHKEEARQRYWSRSYCGWPRVRNAEPNRCHEIVAELETAGVVTGVVTQNVDGLHQAAGSRLVLELHGALERVICLSCGTFESRESVQQRLKVYNPGFHEAVCGRDGSEIAPDGDIELPAEMTRGFQIPSCLKCGGILKPDVVFFGDSVPSGRVDKARQMVTAAEALLVVGSSLTVFSGFRFIKQACSEEKPIVIMTIGPTRGDKFAEVKIDAPLSIVLEEFLRRLYFL